MSEEPKAQTAAEIRREKIRLKMLAREKELNAGKTIGTTRQSPKIVK